ncbi:MAG: DUF3800 domain-containing protein [Candidatus Tyrphobacter sp.]
MHLCYIDDSGTAEDPSTKVLVLGGLSIFERQSHWISRGLDTVAARFNAEEPHLVELHSGPMYHGRGEWRRIPKCSIGT